MEDVVDSPLLKVTRERLLNFRTYFIPNLVLITKQKFGCYTLHELDVQLLTYLIY
jgi:hypothetical protein